MFAVSHITGGEVMLMMCCYFYRNHLLRLTCEDDLLGFHEIIHLALQFLHCFFRFLCS